MRHGAAPHSLSRAPEACYDWLAPESMQIFPITRRKTYGVKVGHYQVGGGAPVVVQSMTNTDTADIAGTVAQCKELADAGSELVRITVNMPESAAAVAEIVARL